MGEHPLGQRLIHAIMTNDHRANRRDDHGHRPRGSTRQRWPPMSVRQTWLGFLAVRDPVPTGIWTRRPDDEREHV